MSTTHSLNRLRPVGSSLLLIGLVTVIYAVTSVIGQEFAALPPGNVTAIWAPSGIALAIVVLFGYRALPGVALGSFIGNTNLIVPGKEWIGLLAAVLIGLGAALEAAAGAYAIKRATPGRRYLDSIQSIFIFVAFGALLACLINASIGSTVLVLAGYAPAEIHPSLWLTWWLGDAMGVLIFAPILLVWSEYPALKFNWRLVERGAAVLALLGAGYVVFGLGFPLEYLLIPIMVLTVLRSGRHGASLSIVLLAVVAILGTAAGRGTFAVYGTLLSDSNAPLLLLQTFLGTVSTAILLLAAVVFQQQLAEQRLADLNRSLESTVQQRTRQLAEAKDAAENANKAKSDFLANMSHELRTPLNAVTGYTSIILEGLSGEIDDEARYMLQRVYANSEHLLGLINQVLDMSKIESGRVEIIAEPFEPAKLVNKWQRQVSVLAEEKHLAFKIDLDPQLPQTLVGDAERISQIALNLLGNAIKFTAKGGITLNVRKCDQHWEIAIEDTGIGIPPHALDTIFEEFRQIDNSSARAHGGTGLGLSISRNLAKLMGGSIHVESVLQQGSTFTVRLPLVVAAPVPA